MGLNIVSMLIVWMRFRDQIIGGRVIAPLIINAVVISYLLQPNVKAASSSNRRLRRQSARISILVGSHLGELSPSGERQMDPPSSRTASTQVLMCRSCS